MWTLLSNKEPDMSKKTKTKDLNTQGRTRLVNNASQADSPRVQKLNTTLAAVCKPGRMDGETQEEYRARQAQAKKAARRGTWLVKH